MKNNIVKRFVLRYFQIALICSAAYFLIFITLDNLLNGEVADILHIIFPWFYSGGVLKILIVWIVYFLAALAFTFGYAVYTAVCLQRLHNAYSSLSDGGPYLPLPKILKDAEANFEEIRENMRLRELLINAEAEQRKNDLIMYIAHDLKTPLTSVIGYLSILKESPELPTEFRAKYTKITLDKAYRLEQLINEFFEITRFNLHNIELERGRMNLSLMLRQLSDEFYPMLESKNLSLQLSAPDEIMLTGDADKLARVFDNLLKNAVNYSYPGTQITVTATAGREKAVVNVRNQGDRIPPEKLPRIFEKFFRSDESRGTAQGGAGLGLAIAKEIAALHGGNITAVSTPEYTEFSVILPLTEE